MRLAAKDKEDVWNVCDGDTLYLYERERITNNKQWQEQTNGTERKEKRAIKASGEVSLHM